MISRQKQSLVYAAIVLLAAVGIILDALTPLGVADWVFYFIPLLLSVYVGGRHLPYVLAAVFSSLTLAGVFLPGPGIDFQLGLISRLTGVGVQWLMAFLIAQRKRAEQAMRRSEEEFRALTGSATDQMYMVDRRHRMTAINPAAASLIGKPSEEIVGRTLAELFPEKVARDFAGKVDQVLATGRVISDLEEKIRIGDREAWNLTTLSPVKDANGVTTAVVGIGHDITRRRQAEMRVNQLNQLKEELLKPAPLEAKLDRITGALVTICAADFARIWLVRPGDRCAMGCPHAQTTESIHACPDHSRCLHLLASSGRYTRLDSTHGRVPLGCYKIGRVAAGVEPGFVTNDVQHDPRVHDHEWAARLGLTAFAGYKLNLPDGRPIGVLAVFARHTLAPDEVLFLEMVAKTASQVIQAALIEEELRDNEARFRLLAESSLAGIYLFQNDKFVYVNPALAAIFGYTIEELTGRLGPQDLTHFEDRPLVAENVRRRLAEEVPQVRYEFRGLRRDGSVINVESHGGRIEYGGKTAIMGMLLDITERKQVEEALAKERSLLKALMDNIPDKIYFKDRESRFVRVNPDLARHFGLSNPAEAVGKTDFDFFSEEHARKAYEDEQTIVRTGEPLVGKEEKETWPDGRTGWVSTTKMPLRNQEGQIVGTFGISRDITQRKQAEETLSKERDLFQALMDNIPDKIYFKDRESRFTRINPDLARHFGLGNPEEAVGKTDFDFFSEEHARQAYEDEQAILRTGEPLVGKVEKETWPDGRIGWVSTTKMPLRDQEGQIVGTFGISRDITERKQAEMALCESEQQLNSIFDLAQVGIMVVDADSHNIVSVNPAACQMLGRPREEIVGRACHHHVCPVEKGRCPVTDLGQKLDRTERVLLKNGCQQIPILKSVGRAVIGGRECLIESFLDISDRKRAEQQLFESFDFIQKIVSGAPAGIVVYKATGPCVLANEAAARMLDATQADLLKQDFRQIASWRTSGMYEMAEEALAGKPRSGEFIIASTFGKELRVTCHFSAFVRGNESHLLLLFNDVFERKQAEETLANERVLLRTLVDHLPVAIYLKDLAGRKTLVNRKELDYLGATSEAEVLGKTDSDLYPPEQAARYHATDQEIIRTGQPLINHEASFTKPDGSVINVLASIVPLRDAAGRVTGLAGVTLDVTERKQAKEKIREQAALLDQAQDAILILDLDDRIVYWNKGAERIYGWSAAEAIGKKPVDVLMGGVISPQHAEAIKIVKERGEWSGELQEVTKDGQSVTVQGRCNVICDEQGRPKARLIINTDITERKKLEAQFLRAQRMENLGILAGGIAHDLNNVLTPLLVSIGFLKEKLTDADGQRLLAVLDANVQRGSNLVKQVLTFGRGFNGERIAVNSKHIAREIRQIVAETFPKSIRFELDCSADLWTITGEPTQIEQVLLNLCVNARDAMPDGGKLCMRMENVLLDEAYAGMNPDAKPGPYVLIEVKDNGTGIPREIQERIFDPFFTTKEPGKGTGLGLSTSLGIVKSYGGFINCYSEPGKGSSFKVYFPANTAPVGADRMAAGPSNLPRGHNELVLVVDDEEPIRRTAQQVLEQFGYRVLLASDGSEAVTLYRPRRNEIDAVITDMVMPVMDGPATIAALRGINPEVKIVASSGIASDGAMARARDAGLRHFIPKPFTVETILYALHEVLNGKG